MLKTFNQIEKEIHDISGVSNPRFYLYDKDSKMGVYYPVKQIDTFKKGNEATITDIANFADDNDFSLFEYGNNTAGGKFILLKHPHTDFIISFVYTGHTYECIYNDFE